MELVSFPLELNSLYNSKGYYSCKCNSKNLSKILALLNLDKTKIYTSKDYVKCKLICGTELIIYIDNELEDMEVYKI